MTELIKQFSKLVPHLEILGQPRSGELKKTVKIRKSVK